MIRSRGKLTHTNTDWVPAEQRVSYWEDNCRAALVGLRCSSHAQEGLQARQSCLDLDLLRVARIQGNAHVIERTPELIRAFPADSIFVNVVLADDTFLYQRGHCFNVHKGDVVLYDARHSYLVGCAGHIDQFHVDLSASYFRERFLREGLEKPVQIPGSSGVGKVYGPALRALLQDTLDASGREVDDPERLRDQVCDLLASMIQGIDGRTPRSALGASHVLAAKAYIEAHLADESLTVARVAHAAGVSVRHLRRLFSQQGSPLAEYILARRLASARAQLCDPLYGHLGIAEVGYRWGFSSHAHFSHVFKAEFGAAPSVVRAQALR